MIGDKGDDGIGHGALSVAVIADVSYGSAFGNALGA